MRLHALGAHRLRDRTATVTRAVATGWPPVMATASL